jgi:hypothetical protein
VAAGFPGRLTKGGAMGRWRTHALRIALQAVVVVAVAVGTWLLAHHLVRPPWHGFWAWLISAASLEVAITAACCSSVIWYFQHDDGLVHAGEPVTRDEPSADTAVLAAD